jgi:hypothetical protein
VAPLEDIVAQVRKQPRDVFARVCRSVFFFLRIDTARSSVLPSDLADVLPAAPATARSHPDDVAVLARCRFVAIVKAGLNPFADRIRLGRDAAMDVVLDHASLSRMHAHVFLRDDATYLSDAASRRGTRVGGALVGRHDRVCLAPFDDVTFGDLHMTYLTAAGLHELVRGLLPISSIDNERSVELLK